MQTIVLFFEEGEGAFNGVYFAVNISVHVFLGRELGGRLEGSVRNLRSRFAHGRFRLGASLHQNIPIHFLLMQLIVQPPYLVLFFLKSATQHLVFCTHFLKQQDQLFNLRLVLTLLVALPADLFEEGLVSEGIFF